MERLVGKGLDKVISAFHYKRLKGWHEHSQRFESERHLGRFRLLASMLAQKDVRVSYIKGDPAPGAYRKILHRISHPALLADYGFGWSDGESIFLPVCFCNMHNKEEEDEMACILIFFLSSQIKHGTLSFAAANRLKLNNTPLLSDIYWILENHRLSRILFKEFPGILAKWDKITAHLLKKRPPLGKLNAPERLIEKLLQDHVLTDQPLSLPSRNPSESLKMAETIILRWRQEGIPIKRYRGMLPFPVWGRLVVERLLDGSADTDKTNSVDRDNDPAHSSKRENSGNNTSRYLAIQEEVDEEKNDRGLMLNIYDKIISWVQFVNVTRPFDDEHEEDIGKKADQMEELNIAPISRHTNSFFDTELEKVHNKKQDTTAYETKEGVFLYSEWDYRKNSYLKDFSRLTENVHCEENGDFVKTVLREKRAVIKDIKRRLEALTPERQMVNRQLNGDFVDIDAFVSAVADIKAGKQADERLYMSYKRKDRDISVLFLIDLSMSTDAWVKDRRIIDHEKEAITILCESIKGLRDRYAIYGFSGKTNKRCDFFLIKGFAEPYNSAVMNRIEGLIPYQYTRIGPAVRHAASILREEPSRLKLLFVISDGKPNDLDMYEGRYGVEDTRMAIKELNRDGIVPFCLTIDTHAREYLPRLFGKGNYAVVAGADRLNRALPELYARIISVCP